MTPYIWFPKKDFIICIMRFTFSVGRAKADICLGNFLIYLFHFYSILNKSWRQHPTRHQLYGHLPPITKTIQVRRARYAGHCWRSKDELISDVLLWTPHMAEQKQNDQLEHTYSSYVRIWNVALKTCQRR